MQFIILTLKMVQSYVYIGIFRALINSNLRKYSFGPFNKDKLPLLASIHLFTLENYLNVLYICIACSISLY